MALPPGVGGILDPTLQQILLFTDQADDVLAASTANPITRPTRTLTRQVLRALKQEVNRANAAAAAANAQAAEIRNIHDIVVAIAAKDDQGVEDLNDVSDDVKRMADDIRRVRDEGRRRHTHMLFGAIIASFVGACVGVAGSMWLTKQQK